MAESKGFEPLRRCNRLHDFQSCSFGHSDSSPMAPQVGLEPTTNRLTADCSTTELLRNNICLATSYSHRGKPPTTIGAEELNFRVRYGNGCDLFAIITRLIILDNITFQKVNKFFIFFQNWITFASYYMVKSSIY